MQTEPQPTKSSITTPISKFHSEDLSEQKAKTDLARSVFIFNTPAPEQTHENGRKFLLQFGMRKCRFKLPENPQTFSFVYLLTDSIPADFPHPRVYNFSEVPSDTTKPDTSSKPAKPSRPNKILNPTGGTAVKPD